jgi:hypothetical protein
MTGLASAAATVTARTAVASFATRAAFASFATAAASADIRRGVVRAIAAADHATQNQSPENQPSRRDHGLRRYESVCTADKRNARGEAVKADRRRSTWISTDRLFAR